MNITHRRKRVDISDWHFRVYWHSGDKYTWGFYIGSRRKSSPSPKTTREACEESIKDVNIIGLPVYFSEPAKSLYLG